MSKITGIFTRAILFQAYIRWYLKPVLLTPGKCRPTSIFEYFLDFTGEIGKYKNVSFYLKTAKVQNDSLTLLFFYNTQK